MKSTSSLFQHTVQVHNYVTNIVWHYTVNKLSVSLLQIHSHTSIKETARRWLDVIISTVSREQTFHFQI
jgi:hypothetical protein